MKHTKDSKIIVELCDHYKITQYQLAMNLGYKSPSSIYHIAKGRKFITTKLANKIIAYYPEINFMYLIGEDLNMLAHKEIIEQQIFLKKAESVLKQNFKEQFVNLINDVALIKRQQAKIIKILSKLAK